MWYVVCGILLLSLFSTSGGFSKGRVSAKLFTTPPQSGPPPSGPLYFVGYLRHSVNTAAFATRRMIVRVPLRALLRPSRLLCGDMRSVETEAGYHGIADATFDTLCEGLERIEDKFDAIDHSYSV